MLINKKFWAIGIIGVLVLSTVGVLAFSNKNEKNETTGMQAMHGQTAQNSGGLSLQEKTGGMHNDCNNRHNDGGHHGNSAGVNHTDSMMT